MFRSTTLVLLAAVVHHCSGQAQITALDSPLFVTQFRNFRNLAFNFIGTTGDNANKFKINYRQGVSQRVTQNVHIN